MFAIGNSLWNMIVSYASILLLYTPASYSSAAYSTVAVTLHDYLYATAAVVLNLMFYAGLCKQLSNFRQNLTLEICIEGLLRVFGANLLLQLGPSLMSSLFRMAQAMNVDIYELSAYTGITFSYDVDYGSVAAEVPLGLIYIVVAASSSITILITVFSRFFNLYLMMAMYPFAVATLPGMQGISNSFAAFVKTFLQKVFAVVVLAIALLISEAFASDLSIVSFSSGIEILSGADDVINNMIAMVLIAAGVKGADTLMHRALGL